MRVNYGSKYLNWLSITVWELGTDLFLFYGSSFIDAKVQKQKNLFEFPQSFSPVLEIRVSNISPAPLRLPNENGTCEGRYIVQLKVLSLTLLGWPSLDIERVSCSSRYLFFYSLCETLYVNVEWQCHTTIDRMRGSTCNILYNKKLRRVHCGWKYLPFLFIYLWNIIRFRM